MINRIVFFQPRTLAADNYLNSAGAEQRWAPWAALVLSPIALKAGISVDLIDARVTPENWADRVAKLDKTDLLAVSVMTGHAIRDAVVASKIAREHGIKVVWGGPHVTLFPQQTLQQAPVDAVIPGFGYEPLSLLIDQVLKGNWPDKHNNGIFVKDDNTWPVNVKTAPYNRIPDSLLGPADLDLIPEWDPYLNEDVAIASRTVNFITSEGCGRRCTYCSEPRTSEGVWLTRNVEASVAVAQELTQKCKANGLKLHDPNFFHDLGRALEFARSFFKIIGLPWAATLHPADLSAISQYDLAQLAQLGLVRVLVGLESPDPKIVRLAGKQYDPVIIPQLVTKLANAGIRGMFTFIVGWPDASPNHYEKTIKCAFEVRDTWNEHQAKIHFLEPWPGTPIFELLVRRGFQAPATLNEWADIDYYQARYNAIHDQSQISKVRAANNMLSPYVNA